MKWSSRYFSLVEDWGVKICDGGPQTETAQTFIFASNRLLAQASVRESIL